VRWLGELARHSAELAQRDIGIVAIAADSVADTSALEHKVQGVALLSDLDLSASAAWGLRAAGADSPSPGTFVVGRDGKITYRRLEDPSGDWPTYAELAAALP
jgi:peroxiredoxin